METVIIRQSRKKNLGMVVVSGMFILYYFLGPYEYTRMSYSESPYLTCILGFIFFGGFFYYLKQFVMQPAEIVLSDDGIELKGSGWNQWNYVSSCWTIFKVDIENHVDTEYLIIKLKDNTQLKCLISELDKSGEEIIDLLRKFKPDIIFNGLRNN